MASKWRELIPHFLAMFVLYFLGVLVLSVVFNIQSFWSSLVIALSVAFLYPTATRQLGVEPELWRRD